MRTYTGIAGALLLAACSPGGPSAPSGPSSGPASEPGAAAGPPAPNGARAPCVFSADCPAGEHCDLEQCTQDCNTVDPCTGQLTCTPRARCSPAAQPDADPAPTSQYAGALTVSPQTVLLTDRDTSFAVTLTSTSAQPVRYRVALDGPHLALGQATGAFTGSTRLTFQVQSSGLQGRNVAGTVHLITTLGDADVSAPLHVGLTGSYKGTLLYDGGPVNLGQTRFALDVVESGGDAQLRVVSQDSLLFPVIDSRETTGHGSYTATQGLDATLGQVIAPDFGGTRNHFGRPIGRQLRLQLQPDAASSSLAGTFTETLVGLFAEPVMTSGHVSLEYVQQGSDPSFTVGADPVMPPSPAPSQQWDLSKVFAWNEDATCASFARRLGYTPSAASVAMAVQNFQRVWAQPLTDTFTGGAPSDPSFYENTASACQTSIAAQTDADYTGNATQCGLVAGVACAVQLATTVTSSDPTIAPLASLAVQQLLAPGLLVAKNSIVAAVSDSFSGGIAQEQADYAAASATLAPFAEWVTQPAVLEYLRGMPPAWAAGPAPTSTANEAQPYPAARALADLFLTASIVDGETARIAASTGAGSSSSSSASMALSGALATEQENALVGYLEAATLSEILAEWGPITTSIGAKATGVLTPLDRAYASLLDGANVLGVPAGFVPFAYRPEDVAKGGATNFEQVLALATPDLAKEASDEASFIANNRAYEVQQTGVANELLNVRSQFTTHLQNDCGMNFDPDAITSVDGDWTSCGAGGDGALASAILGIAKAKAEIASAQAHVTGAKQRLDIDVGAVQALQSLNQQAVTFTEQNGEELAENDYASAELSAFQQALAVASNASAGDFGAAVGEGAVALGIGLVQADLTESRDRLQTAQAVNTEQIQGSKDYVAGMTAVDKDMIDLTQASIDGGQAAVDLLSAKLLVTNTLDDAKETWENRQRALDVIAHDPTHDPSYRILRDSFSEKVVDSRLQAQFDLNLALNALAYELNMSLDPSVVLNAQSQNDLQSLQTCLTDIFGQSRIAYGSAQDYTNTVSIRALLGVTGPRTDPVTGETLSEGDQFRRFLLANQNLDGQGGVGIRFATDLQPGNGLWAADLCNDRISSVQAELVGDFLGDNEAQITLSLGGAGVMRACDLSTLQTWSFGASSPDAYPSVAVIQAGVNGFGDDVTANTSLFGQPVARASWVLTVPGGQDAPANADVELTHIDDIVLKILHRAQPGQGSALSPNLNCLSAIGNTP